MGLVFKEENCATTRSPDTSSTSHAPFLSGPDTLVTSPVTVSTRVTFRRQPQALCRRRCVPELSQQRSGRNTVYRPGKALGAGGREGGRERERETFDSQ